MSRVGTFDALRHLHFRRYWFGLAVTNLGWWIQMFALGWLMVEIAEREGDVTRAPFYIGLMGLARAVPAFALSLIGGAIADRLERRRIMIRASLAGTSLMTILALAVVTGHASVPVVLAVTLLLSVTAAFDGPARQSMMPRLIPPSDLVSAVGLQNMAVHGTAIVGPALGGLLILSLGVGGLLFLTAASYAPMVWLLSTLPVMPPVADAGTRSILRSVADGIVHVVHDPVLRWLFITHGVVALLSRPYLHLLPAFVATELRLGAPELSLLLTFTGVGAVSASLALASLGRFPRRGLIWTVASVATALLTTLFAKQTSFAPVVVVSLLLGFITLVFMGLSSTIIQTTTPPHLLGRVMSMMTLTVMGVTPVGQLVIGSLGSAYGLGSVLFLGGIVTVAVTLLAAVRGRAIRGLGPPAEAPV
ncbi:MAG: MFS transporter [Chloroflexi bacterium]|nr:MFS transporter [Chloroflexota bacterium]